MTERNDVLDDELVRATPGLRPISCGVLRLARQLGLQIADGKAPESREEKIREILSMTWLLDLRHSLEEIKLAAADLAGFAAKLEEYEFGLRPEFLMMVQREISLTNAAVNAAAVGVQPKPTAPSAKPEAAPPPPPPNS